MGQLHEDTSVTGTDGSLKARISEDWKIWGPNGGYLAAIALRAAGTAVPQTHRPATMSCQFLAGGRFGPADVTVTPVKQGRMASCLNVKLANDGEVFMQAQIWTTAKEKGPENADRMMPDVPAPDDLPTMEELSGSNSSHPFWSNFDRRPVGFLPPGQIDERGAAVQQWFRYPGHGVQSDPFIDAGRAVVLLDTLMWPAHWRTRPDEPDYIAPSLDLSVWFHSDVSDSEWLLVDSKADTASAGLIYGSGSIWSRDGRLMATAGSHMMHRALQ